MARSSLPAQALPPDKRPKEPPPPFESMMPSGLMVKWRMPRIRDLIAFDGRIPDPFTAATIDLLEREKSYTSEDDPQRHMHRAANILGMLHLTAAMWESPKFDPTVEYGEGETLGEREVGYQDHVAMFQQFRFTTRQPVAAPAQTNKPQRPADAPSDSDGLRTDASAAAGDS